MLADFLLVTKASFKPEDNWQMFRLVKDYSIVHITHCFVTVSLAGIIPNEEGDGVIVHPVHLYFQAFLLIISLILVIVL